MDDTYSEWSSMTKLQTNLIGLGILILIILASCTAQADLIKKRPVTYTEWYTNVIVDLNIDPEYEIYWEGYETWIQGHEEFCTFEDYLFNEGYCEQVIPEPLALGLIGIGGLSLFMLKRKLR